MYSVNWQRSISVGEINGRKVVIKRSLPTREFHEYLLVATFAFLSVLLARPTKPPLMAAMTVNEGDSTRLFLKAIGIPTPELLSNSDDELVEEFVEGGNLYAALASATPNFHLAFIAGAMTGRLHRAGRAFIDNKAENFLVQNDNGLLRTDLAFLQNGRSAFSQSMDIATFLSSVLDLKCYSQIEREYYLGYKKEVGRGFPYLSLILRNILAPGMSTDTKTALSNLLKSSQHLLSV